MPTLVDKAHGFGSSPAIVDTAGTHSYADLLNASHGRAEVADVEHSPRPHQLHSVSTTIQVGVPDEA